MKRGKRGRGAAAAGLPAQITHTPRPPRPPPSTAVGNRSAAAAATAASAAAAAASNALVIPDEVATHLKKRH